MSTHTQQINSFFFTSGDAENDVQNLVKTNRMFYPGFARNFPSGASASGDVSPADEEEEEEH